MAGSFRKYEIIKHSPSPFFFTETTSSSSFFPPPPSSISLFTPLSLLHHHDLDLDLDLLNPTLNPIIDSSITDLIHFETTPFASYKRLVRRTRVDSSELYLQSLCDRVAAIESKFDRLLETKSKKINEVDRKYTWTAEIKGALQARKYKWTAEIDADNEKKGKRGERKYQWTTEFKGTNNDDEKRTYTWKATIGGNKKEEKVKNKKKKESSATRIVEIEEPCDDHRTLVLRQAFAKRAEAAKDKGKKKELSPLDAAAMIQMSFRAYLIRRSKALRALRELAVAKTKLKELRALFHNFSYRSRIARDAEERQKFSEKIIVLLLTVDAIEGVDLMVRAAKRSMVDELEAMLDVVDPQPVGRTLSMRRRTFDMPTGDIQKEIAEGVAQVVEMLDQENASFDT